jgi:NAD(P)-dependent dehydrogenase (short-subunit alcohol dehydrogenase family)
MSVSGGAGRFDGKVLFATGGGSGIAAATARRFTADGGRVAVVDMNVERAEQVAATLEGAIGLAADVGDEDSVLAAVTAAHQAFGRIDCVLNAAGHAEFGPIEDWSLERWNRMLGAHVGGTFLVCKHVLPILKAQQPGASIVNIASTAALTANNFNAPYGAAKGAIVSFSRQLSRDVAPDIRVNVVAPGRVRTGMTEPLVIKRGDGDFAAGAKIFAEVNLMKRLGDPEELAAPICFLLSDEASFITGTTLVADGGETAI